MTLVIVEFHNNWLIEKRTLSTTNDTAYIFDDIANELLDEQGEFKDIPEGTKEIVLKIPCEGF